MMEKDKVHNESSCTLFPPCVDLLFCFFVLFLALWFSLKLFLNVCFEKMKMLQSVACFWIACVHYP